jgi:hypothetical protein
MVSFLTHLDEAKYKATASLGNLPLKGVRAVNDLLVQPAPLKQMVGDEVISEVRLVSDVWAIFFLQGLAMMNNLVVFEPGRRITVTEEGRRFLESSPSRQLWVSLYAWWWVAEWDMAYSWEVFEDFSQTGLPFLTRQLLLTMPVGKRIEADEFIAIVGEMLQAAQTPVNPMLLKPAVKFMILNVLEDFEIITLKKKTKKPSGFPIEEVIWFKMTPFGHQLLRSI